MKKFILAAAVTLAGFALVPAAGAVTAEKAQPQSASKAIATAPPTATRHIVAKADAKKAKANKKEAKKASKKKEVKAKKVMNTGFKRKVTTIEA